MWPLTKKNLTWLPSKLRHFKKDSGKIYGLKMSFFSWKRFPISGFQTIFTPYFTSSTKELIWKQQEYYMFFFLTIYNKYFFAFKIFNLATWFQ